MYASEPVGKDSLGTGIGSARVGKLRAERAHLHDRAQELSSWRRLATGWLDLLIRDRQVCLHPPGPALADLWSHAQPGDPARQARLVRLLTDVLTELSLEQARIAARQDEIAAALVERVRIDPAGWTRRLLAESTVKPAGPRPPDGPALGAVEVCGRLGTTVDRPTRPDPAVDGPVDGPVCGGSRVDDYVRQAPLFAALDDEAADALRRSMIEVRLGRGEVLFREGEPGDRLFVVTEGKIKLGRSSPDGRENLLAVLGPGELFGELSLFDPGPRTATATAVTDAALLGVGHADIKPWLAQRPQVAAQLLQALAQRLRRTNDTVADLVFSDVPGRVAKALLDLADRFGEQRDDGLHVSHDLTQEELAQLVGASRETVNKALADFAARGWLRLEARAVVLLDLERLQRRSR